MVDIGLPEEVWRLVFGRLSSADKCSVRSSCRFFKRLIDQPALWRKSTVYLERKLSSYRSHFWRTLSRRRTSSVVLPQARKAAEWTELARRLPWLVSLTVRACCHPKALKALHQFKKLERLEIRHCRCPSLENSLTGLTQLKHISFCEVPCAPAADIAGAVSQLTNITSFHYHESNKPIPKAALHKLLRDLPNLKHLSLNMAMQGTMPNDYLCPTKATWQPGESRYETLGLTSLELLNYMDPILYSGALQSIPCLTSLVIQYESSASDSSPCHLGKWLSNLPDLSQLRISRGHPLEFYSASVPGTVQSLSLTCVEAELDTVRAMAKQLPDLSFLHLDLYCREKQSLIAEVPQLFPKVQTLEMRHHNVLKTEFLQLAQMSHLKRLVVLDPYMDPSSALTNLTSQFNLLTNYRVQVIHSSELRDRNACLCSQY